jgi:hypothetical protein
MATKSVSFLFLGLSAALIAAACDGTETGDSKANNGGNVGEDMPATLVGGTGTGQVGGSSGITMGGSASKGGSSSSSNSSASTGTISCLYKSSSVTVVCVTGPGTSSDCSAEESATTTATLVASCPAGALLTCSQESDSGRFTMYMYDQSLVDEMKQASPSDPCEA